MSNNKDFKVKNGIKPTVYHEAVRTIVPEIVGYSLVAASYDSKSFSVSAQDTGSFGLAFKSDGTKMYMSGGATDSVYQYTLSTAWDISTASYDSVTLSVTTQDAAPFSLTFKPDGTVMYIAGSTNDTIFQYTLSTAWDLSTASYASKSLSVASQETNPMGIAFKTDGTKMYVGGPGTDSVYQYSLSTAWDVSTGTYDGVSFSGASQGTAWGRGLFFTPDGLTMLATDSFSDRIYKYTLSSAWDLSTASYSSESYSVASQSTAPGNLFFKDDGTKMYVIDGGSATVYQYSTFFNSANLDLSTGSVFELTPTTDITVSLSNPAASGTVSGATLLLASDPTPYDLANASEFGVFYQNQDQSSSMADVTLSTDGTKMYLCSSGATNAYVYQYTLSTPHDVTTASYDSVRFSTPTPTGIAFRSDGLRAYIVGGSSTIYEHSLSTAWDLSTMSSSIDTYSVLSWVTTISAVALNPDGTEIFVLDTSGSRVHKVLLSTAWDLTTASHSVTTLNLSAKTTTARSLFVTSDGTKLFTDDGTYGKILRYDLSTAFDLSTATFTSEFDHPTVSSWGGVHLDPNGGRMYALDLFYDNVIQYDLGPVFPVTYDTSIQWAGGTAPTSPSIGETDILTFSTRDGGTTYNAVLAIDGAQ